MSYRIGVKPGKAVSALGMVLGGLFILLGVFLVIPTFGAFGWVWTAGAAAIVIYYAFNFFSKQGISAYEVNVEDSGGSRE
jgi:hypothetical protein